MTEESAHELEIAAAAVRRAARVTEAVQRNLVTAETLEKKDRSPVTVADYASQAVVAAALAEAFPEDPMVGEEHSAALREPENEALRTAVVEHVASVVRGATEQQVLNWIDRGASSGRSERFWTLDPIDGTKGFLRGEQYAIALALIENGHVMLGVLGCPNLPRAGGKGVLMTAVRGQGARAYPLDGPGMVEAEAVRVSDVRRTDEARFCESVESGHSNQSQSARIAEELGIAAEPVRMDSQAKYAAVARGDAQIYLRMPTRADYQEKIWDHAAGAIIVEEAGGTVTDVHGKPLDFSLGRSLSRNSGVVATNTHIHNRVLSAIEQVLGAVT